MIKTFITGIVLGIAGVIAALYVVPVVDQHREQSIISMSTNGGNSEAFHVNIPIYATGHGMAGRGVDGRYPR